MKIFLILLLSFSTCVFAQSLHDARILKVSDRKRSIFIDKGIFHYDATDGVGQSLEGLRNSYDGARGYERLVFDFQGPNPPRIYGMINQSEKKVYIDLFDTAIGSQLKALKNTKYVKSVDFFSLDSKNLSVEVNFKNNVTFDIFILKNPGRLVIDVKK